MREIQALVLAILLTLVAAGGAFWFAYLLN